MLITRPYISPEKQFAIDLKDYDILLAKRKLLFFVNKDEYETGCIQYGKAIQINVCADKCNESDISRQLKIRTHNTTNIKISVYTYDVAFVNGALDFMNTCLTLKEAYSFDEMNDFDEKNYYKSQVGTYDQDVSTTDGRMEMLANAGIPFEKSNIIDPKYYNEKHEFEKIGDTYSIIWDTSKLSYFGYELIDPNTSVEVHDLKTWDTMIPMLKKEIMMKSENRFDPNPVNFITNMFIPTCEAMMGAYTFIYDTDMGINVKPIQGMTSVPAIEFRLKENLISNLNQLKDLVQAEAKMIEAKDGPIRLYYVPLFTGDKLKIIYKDNNPDNQISDFGKTKIDKGYSIKEEMVRSVQLVSEIGDDGEPMF